MRKKKDTAEYFPHQSEHGKTLFIIDKKWGNDGYACFFRLLELLCKTDGHYLELSTEESRIYAAAYCNVAEDLLMELIALLVATSKIDKPLWQHHQVIWYPSFVDGLAPLYRNRRRDLPAKPVFQIQDPILHVETPKTTGRNPVKYSKVKESIKRVREIDVKSGIISKFGELAVTKSSFITQKITINRLILFGVADA